MVKIKHDFMLLVLMSSSLSLLYFCTPVLALLSNTLNPCRQQVLLDAMNKNGKVSSNINEKYRIHISSSTNSKDKCEIEKISTEQNRRSLLIACISSVLVASNVPQSSALAVVSNLSQPSIPAPQTITVPLSLVGGAYLIYYRVESALFRAVLDTGSPFLMIPGSCSQNTRAKAGCYKQQGAPSGLATTLEQFDGFEGMVEWRRAPFSFVNATGSMIVSSPTVVFGVADDNVMSGPGGVFFGLIKETNSWIRPSFLGQTDVTSFIINLRNGNTAERDILKMNDNTSKPLSSPSLTLSTVPYLSLVDYIPMTKDLRRVGDPVQHYVSKLKSISINGTPLIPKDKRPIYAIFDTGVTGMVMSRELYDQRYMEARERKERRLWGGEVELTFETARKNMKTIHAVKPLTTPFDPKATWKKFRGHVIVLGLSFLDDKELTVDMDDGRIWLE